MLRMIWNSKSGMMAQQEKLDAISNNMSNLNTTGYKKVEVNFSDLVQETLNRKGYPVSENNARTTDPYTGTGVKTGDWTRNDKQGSLQVTNTITDLALDGKGYYKVNQPNGNIAYTRNSSFTIDPDGTITDGLGNRLQIKSKTGEEVNAVDGNDPNKVRFTKDNFHVDDQGNVYSVQGTTTKNIGKINIYSGTGEEALHSIGGSLYSLTPGAQEYVVKPEDVNIRQGFTEASNVDMASEMTDMLLSQKAFELSSRGLRTADEMWQMANNLKGR